MKERPILMTPENAQKCHVGTKTQTRRIVKPQPTVNEHGYFQWTPRSEGHNGVYTPDSFLAECPYGVPGDRLWVREAWTERTDIAQIDIAKRAHYVRYKGNGSNLSMEFHSYGKWKPAMHMFRWACRTVVEITEIRVQRVQEISEDDARAEGCSPVVHEDGAVDCGTRKTTFRQLWGSINGPGSWGVNPWVWAISFRKVQI